jgi:hypothetical protein
MITDVIRTTSTSYAATTNGAEIFGKRMYEFAIENGLKDMDMVVFISDGAIWLKKIQEKFFAISVLDKYHVIEHVSELVKSLNIRGAKKREAFANECITLLKRGDGKVMIEKFEETISKTKTSAKQLKSLTSKLGYFTNNLERMDYGIYSVIGIPCGSGMEGQVWLNPVAKSLYVSE